jgi:triacylglycerol lipase
MRFRRLGALALTLTIAGTTAACTTPPPPKHNPVIFVHGYLLGPANWTTAIAQFTAAGYAPSEIVAIRYDYVVSVIDSAPTLAQAVDEVRARTGAERVDIVSHSLGSLVTKQCILGDAPAGKPDCHGKVAHWMSLAGVDNGTKVELAIAKGQPSNEDVQGRPPVCQSPCDPAPVYPKLQSRWNGTVCQGVSVEVQWTPNDEIVKEPERSREPAPAVNLEVHSLDHISIISDPPVIAETIRFFAS